MPDFLAALARSRARRRMLVTDAGATLYLLASEDGLEPFADLGLAPPALMWSAVTSVLNEMRGGRALRLAGGRRVRAAAILPIERHAGDEIHRDARDVAYGAARAG